MALNSSYREDGEIVILSGDRLTIETATDFARLLREALDASKKVALEFEPEMAIDITGLQIICSACKTAVAGEKSFSYHGPQPEALAALISASGAERHAACKHNNGLTCIWFGGSK